MIGDRCRRTLYVTFFFIQQFFCHSVPRQMEISTPGFPPFITHYFSMPSILCFFVPYQLSIISSPEALLPFIYAPSWLGKVVGCIQVTGTKLQQASFRTHHFLHSRGTQPQELLDFPSPLLSDHSALPAPPPNNSSPSSSACNILLIISPFLTFSGNNHCLLLVFFDFRFPEQGSPFCQHDLYTHH